MPQVLAIDVGNSRVKYGLFEMATRESLPAVRQFLATDLQTPLPVDTLRQWSEGRPLSCVAGGSNPRLLDCLLAEWPALGWPEPAAFRVGTSLPLKIDVDFPERVGLDRLFNALAANRLKSADQAAIIIDAGTATTVDWVTPDGAFAGGAILPGFELGARALHQYTALLPLLGRQELGVPCPSALGKNTRDAMRSGLYWGQVGAIRELTRKLQQQTGAAIPPLMLLTGGGAPILEPEFPTAHRCPALGLQGMLVAWSATAPLTEAWHS